MRIRPFLTLLLLVALCSIARSQWEQVGWPGGEIYVQVQLGNTLYGSSGASYYKSTDMGKNWLPFNDGLPISTFIHSMGGLFTDNNNVCINLAETDSGYGYPEFLKGMVYYCGEHDNKWSSIKLSPINGELPRTDQIFMLSKDTIVACLGNKANVLDQNHGYFFSADGGKTWQRRMTGIPANLKNFFAFHLGRRLFFCSNTSKQPLYASNDLGLSWTKQTTPLSDSQYWNFWLLNDSTIIIGMGGDNSTYHQSTNAGISWSSITFPNSTYPGSSFKDVYYCQQIGSRLFAGMHLVSTSGYSVWQRAVSTDFGLHWTTFSLPDSSALVHKMFGTNNEYFSLVQDGRRLYFFTDSSFATFTPKRFLQGLSNDGRLLYVYNKNLFAAGFPTWTLDLRDSLLDSIWVSSDQGSSWEVKQFSPEFTVRGYEHWLTSGNSVFTTGMEKGTSKPCLIRSSDQGLSWSLDCYLPTTSILKPVLVTGDTILLVEDRTDKSSRVYLSLRHGLTWDALLTPSADTIFDLYYKEGTLYLVAKSITPLNGTNRVFTSIDIGYSWDSTTIFSPPKGKGFFDIFKLGDKWFWNTSTEENAGVPYLLFCTTDNGRHWVEPAGVSEKLQTIPRFTEEGIVYALGCATSVNSSDYLLGDEGRNAGFFSNDSGMSWRQMPGYFTGATDLFSDSEYFYAAGKHELWRIPKDVADVEGKSAIETPLLSTLSCYPNPATTGLTINYSIPQRSRVSLKTYDFTGRERGMLFDGIADAGSHHVEWDTRSLSSGSYILRLSSGGEVVSKVVLIAK